MLKKTATALVALGLLAAPMATSASAEPASLRPAVAAGAQIDLTDAKVSYFGYDGKDTFKSPVIDGSDAKAADPSYWLPKSLVSNATAGKTPTANTPEQPSAVGFYCTLWVGKTILSGGRLEAGTHQTCTGAFHDQYTVAAFDRSSWTGWRSMTSSGTGPSSNNQVNDSTFRVGCNTGGGTYDYRLWGNGMAYSSETGKLVAGDTLYGEKGRYTCGT
ncbi:hypothetical protein [Kitasatospora sp. NPDC093679]|uniref:hypothetical protein n=1 Tax=Kitasatospora sp. NPDC093679 TaxID=3154983 RepID=UPI00343080BE